MRNRLKRLKRPVQVSLVALVLVIVVPVIIPLTRAAIECRYFGGTPAETPAPPSSITDDIEGYRRPEERTYLTIPEWYIVYSIEEHAAFIAAHPPSGFPHFRAVNQYWQSYYDICGLTRDRYAFNSGFHLTLAVIGASFTVENVMKGIYEGTVGRVTEWISTPALTEEDAYARAVDKEYGAFLHTIPWYEFPFFDTIGELWRVTPLWGPNLIRKWERKIALTIEYGLKGIYGWVIRTSAAAIYEPEDLTIRVWAEGVTPTVLQQVPEATLVKTIDAQASIIALERYEPFTHSIPKLAARQIKFIDMAGNDEIVVTLLAPREWSYNLPYGGLLFEMPILTQPELNRVVVKVPVQDLTAFLNTLKDYGVTLEHIYDY